MYQEGFDVERVKKKPKKNTLNPIKSLQRKSHQGLGKLRKEGVGSHSANREWEVGKKNELRRGGRRTLVEDLVLMFNDLSYNRKSNGDF